MTVTITATPAEIELTEHIELRLEIEADKGVTVSDVEYELALSEGDRQFEYRVVRSDEDAAKPTDDGTLRWTYRLELGFFLPGEYELPPAVVSFVDLRSEASEPPTPRVEGRSDAAASSGVHLDAPYRIQTVSTPPITLVVREPKAAAMTPAELRKITRLDPVELPSAWAYWRWLGPLVGLGVVITILMLLRRRRRRREEAVVQIPAHEWARRQMAALIAEDLIARGRVQEFYYRISGIVRGYIERRFGVTAPEMTTEEFLLAAAEDRRFGDDVTEELDRFLNACDLVKYARHEPGAEESDAVLAAAGDFVERTRDRECSAVPSRGLQPASRCPSGSAQAEARGSGERAA